MIDVIVAHKSSDNDKYLLFRLLSSVSHCEKLSPHIFSRIIVVTDNINYVKSISAIFTELSFDFILDKNPSGVYPAFDTGFQRSMSRYCIFMGIDDLLLPSMVKVRQSLESSNIDLIVMDYIHEKKGFISQNVSKYFLVFGNWCQQSVVYSTSALRRLNYLFNYKYPIQADHDLHIRLLSNKNSCNYLYLPSAMSFFSANGLSSSSLDLSFKSDMHKIILSNFGFLYFLLSILRSWLGCIRRFASS